MAQHDTRLSIFGLGYVGAVSAGCFAKLGFGVVGVDIDENKNDMLSRGEAPVMEAGLSELLAEQHRAGRLRATLDPNEAVLNTDISLVCVGTPSSPNGDLNLAPAERVCEQIGRALARKLTAPDAYHVVVIRSTVLPGAVENRLIPILEQSSAKKANADFGVVQNPEFLREGTAIHDFFHPPKTVIGASCPRAAAAVSALYQGIDAPIFVTGIGVASVVKYADNAFHAVKITFANEIGQFCNKLGIDSHEVMNVFCEDRKLNISPAYLRPGFAFGGSCLPKDVRALLYHARTMDLELPLLAGVLPSNESQIRALFSALLPFRRDGIGFLGLSFKPGTDDLRESPIVAVVEALLGKGAEVRVHDPSLRISALVGSNLKYIMSEIPHLGNLLKETAEPVIRSSAAVVVAHDTRAFREAVLQTRPDQTVFDLVRLPNAEKIPGRYVGLCW